MTIKKLGEIHLERWATWLPYQKTIAPFPATISDLCVLWHFDDPHGARNTLNKLVDAGYAIRRGRRGKDVMYFALDPIED